MSADLGNQGSFPPSLNLCDVFSVGFRRGQAWADVFPCLCVGAVGNWAGLQHPGTSNEAKRKGH